MTETPRLSQIVALRAGSVLFTEVWLEVEGGAVWLA